jgi:fucose permease
MFFQGFKFPAMCAYTAENLGTKIRTLGYGIADGIGHLGGAVGPIVFVLLQDHIGLAFSTGVVGIASVISSILIMVFGQITNKIPLEKIKG